MKHFTNHFVLASFLALVVFAQREAWRHDPETSPPAWEATSLSLRSTTGKVLLRLGDFVRRRYDNSVSPEARTLSEIGYTLRYQMGEFPSFIFKAAGGSPDSLHYRTEIPFLYPSSLPKIREELLPAVAALEAFCRAKGARLLVLPVPVKLSLDVPTLRSSELWFKDAHQYEMPTPAWVYQKMVSEIGPAAIDLYSLFRKSRELNPFELYLPYDNHWTSFAIALTASEITRHLSQSAPSVIYHAKRPIRHDTFFMDALRLPTSFTDHARAFRWQEPLFSLAPAAAHAGRVFLAGTSFSDRLKRSEFGLGALLRKGTGREVVDLSISGQGKYASLRSFLQRGLSLSPGDVLIWEFPVSQAGAKDGTFPLPISDKLL